MKKALAVSSALLLGISLTLTACGSGGNNSSNGETGSKNTGSNASSAPSGKIDELTIAFPSASPKDLQLVEDAINKITEQKIQARVHFMPISGGEWVQQTNLMLTSNEKLDLMFVSGALYNSMVTKEQLVPLDELLDKDGEGIKSAVGDYLNAAKVNNKIYAIPTVRDMASDYGITMRKDLVDKYNIDTGAVKTLDDLGNVLKTIKDGEGFAPLIPSSPGQTYLDNYLFYDRLGDGIGVLPGYDNGLKVVNLYETQEYKELLTRLRDWYQQGYIMKDSATTKTTPWELIKSNKGFAYFAGMKPGFAEQESQAAGTPLVGVELLPAVAMTSTVTGAMWGVPVNTKLEDKAVQFLNLMYSDKDIVNLLDWGIEGTHYVKSQGEENVIEYPSGVDATTTGYNMPLGWMFGNQFLSYVMKGNDPTVWAKTEEFNKAAKRSKALGFGFDPTPVKTEYAAVSNVITQYEMPLETGSVDPEKVLPEFISKLKAAGIDKIIAEKQKQLDAWAQTNSAQ
ncbi:MULTISPECIES: ABC transporter substrate-binding protein [unclassified Paenibacillus]|uniref:ABC transporter substrate-binding protein n=1 Tax=unclassified Paenibacillus TaxID=185978 RepID=UPI00104C1D30|nr:MULTISPECIES: ABC transporter substrate-binding protein [unclassified Paenibacillus]NIK70392.1 putative aldouronate transport system substrate-binding protein [Paenibacillus sp. BK720]TCM90683.1 putative aldouronate transport system substrate-binding protein [Paenibacillus sp. BK033]